MIEADNASTSIYQVLRMSRAAMTHLLIIRMDILTTRPGTYQQDVLQSFKSLYPGKMDMIDAHLAHNPFTGIFELEILAKLFSDVLQ